MMNGFHITIFQLHPNKPTILFGITHWTQNNPNTTVHNSVAIGQWEYINSFGWQWHTHHHDISTKEILIQHENMMIKVLQNPEKFWTHLDISQSILPQDKAIKETPTSPIAHLCLQILIIQHTRQTTFFFSSYFLKNSRPHTMGNNLLWAVFHQWFAVWANLYVSTL